VIHLERLTDRRAFMESNLDRLGVDFAFFSAVDGADGVPAGLTNYDEAKCISRYGLPLRSGEIGCFASHYLLWQECARRNAPLAILEDDVTLSADFPEALALAEERIEKYRFIRLAGILERPFRVIETIGDTRQLIRFLVGPSGTQCYCLSPAGASALLEHAKFWTEPVDQYIDRFWYHGLGSNALVPFAAKSVKRSFPSAIGQRQGRRSLSRRVRRELVRGADVGARIVYNIKDRMGGR